MIIWEEAIIHIMTHRMRVPYFLRSINVKNYEWAPDAHLLVVWYVSVFRGISIPYLIFFISTSTWLIII